MTTFEKLKERIKKDLNIDTEMHRRLYAGYWQKTNGAFVWGCRHSEYKDIWIGSTYTASKLLKTTKPLILLGNWEIIPDY